MQTIGQLATYSIRQGAALETCDARRAAIVSIVDATNAALAPKRKWWPWSAAQP